MICPLRVVANNSQNDGIRYELDLENYAKSFAEESVENFIIKPKFESTCNGIIETTQMEELKIKLIYQSRFSTVGSSLDSEIE